MPRPSRAIRRAAPSAVLLALLAAAPAPASARIGASVAVESATGGARLTVVLTSSKRLPAKARPGSVSVIAGGRTYRLKRAAGAGAAAVRLGTWRSAVQRGPAEAAVRALATRTVTLRITTRAGRTTLKPRVTAPPALKEVPPGAGPTTPIIPGTPVAQPLFTPPPADLTGNAAFDAIKGYFLNSTFTDCVAGWPACAVEQRYGHFADGTQYYCRLTPSSGSDIKSFGTFQVIGADQKTDGSWAISYALASYGNTTYYTWNVDTTGAAIGRYWGPGSNPTVNAPTETIGPLQWIRAAKDCST